MTPDELRKAAFGLAGELIETTPSAGLAKLLEAFVAMGESLCPQCRWEIRIRTPRPGGALSWECKNPDCDWSAVREDKRTDRRTRNRQKKRADKRAGKRRRNV